MAITFHSSSSGPSVPEVPESLKKFQQHYHRLLQEREGLHKFHGGPLDGKVQAVKPPNREVRVAVCDAPQLSELKDGYSFASTQTFGYTEHTYVKEIDPATNVVGYYWVPPK